MKSIDYFIYLIFFIKIAFVIISVFYYLNNKKPNKTTKEKQIGNTLLFWKHRTEHMFIVLLSILLIILFNPYSTTKFEMTPHVKTLIFVYAIIILIQSKWNLYFQESSTFKALKELI